MSTEVKPVDMTAIAQALGELSGELRVSHQNQLRAIEMLREDLHRIEDGMNERINRLEESVGKRLDGMGGRITALEAEDKRLSEKMAGLSALGGTVGGALAAAAVELIKRM
jgi:hypothetical protein